MKSMRFIKNKEILNRKLKENIQTIEEIDTQYSLVEDNDCIYIAYNNTELVGILRKKVDIEGIEKNQVQTLIIIGVLGISLLKDELLDLPRETQIIVIEPNMKWIKLESEYNDLSFLEDIDITIYAGSIENINAYLSNFFLGIRLMKLGNRVIYINEFYQKQSDTLEIIQLIRKSFSEKLYTLGNSIEDSLIGVEHNLKNLKYLIDSKSVARLKDKFKGIPAIVVSAGPSLSKNIHLLKSVKNKYLIIAVDTIVNRLLKEGITPDFICSLERIEQVYDYFYENREYPKEITLVGPPLLDSRILENFEGEKILPLRADIGEYAWLRKVLGFEKEDLVHMGNSCAHTAFGIGLHLGCEPIILIGQDLAFGENEEHTHTEGTIYEEVDLEEEFKVYEVDGYYGEKVKTTEVWLSFKGIFEKYVKNLGAKVINATEGGAKILHTEQLPLKEVLETYSGQDINVYDTIKKATNNIIIKEELIKNLELEEKFIKDLSSEVENNLRKLRGIKIHKKNGGNLEKIRKQLLKTDIILNQVTTHWLMSHLYQAHVVVQMWKYYQLELAVNEDTIKKNIEIQKSLLEPILFTNKKVLEYIDEAKKLLVEEKR